jgi:quinol monooxygenase YgiN
VLLASISFRAHPDKRLRLLNAVNVTLEKVRTLRACKGCRLLFDTEHPDAFTLLSEWSSAREAEAFFNSSDFQSVYSMRTLLKEEPVLVLDEIASRATRKISQTSTGPHNSDRRSPSMASGPRRRV